MYHKYLLTFVQVGQVYVNLTIEAAGTEQGRVKHIGTVSGGQNNDTTIGTKTVHLRE